MELIITASIGITTCPLDDRSSQLIQHADKAMCDAKMAGKNHFSIYHAEQKESAKLPRLKT